MAELAALGLAANIITFVDFAFRLLSQARNVHDSIHGTTAEAGELDLILQDVENLNEEVLGQQVKVVKPTLDDQLILAMGLECQKLSKELRELVNALAMRDGHVKVFESVRVAVLSFRREKSINDLQKRLESLETRVRRKIASAVQRSDRNTAISKQLTDIQKWCMEFDVQFDAKLDLLRDEIMQLARPTDTRNVGKDSVQLASLGMKIKQLASETETCEDHISVLQGLSYPQRRLREGKVRDAMVESNQWIFDPSVTSYVEWLSNEQPRDKFFVITGRAGSGKSTLMKFIYADPLTKKALKTWAGTCKLCTAKFFFWNDGHPMEMSQVGLLQSIIYQILRSIPRLMDIVKHVHAADEAWSVAELEHVLRLIAEQKELDVKFCFFIDGLDEYNGDEEELNPTLQALSSSKNFKICASTRPRRVFEKFFKNQSRTVDIADFTKGDMHIYVRQKLKTPTDLRSLKGTKAKYTELIRSIAEMAQGVWLWVFFVTIDVKQAMDSEEDLAKLRGIVEQFPADLGEKFKRMIDDIRPAYRGDMSLIFLVAFNELQPLPLYAIRMLGDENEHSDYAITRPIAPIELDESWMKFDLERYKSWLQNRCGDLLIVDNEPHPVFLRNSVDFLHRTVRDYLRKYHLEAMTATVKDNFNPTVSLAKMCLALLKSLPIDDFRQRASLHRVIALTDEILYYAHETERACEDQEAQMVVILDEVNRVNTYYARAERLHWSNARNPAAESKFGKYNEGASCNFLGLAIQARLVSYVRAKLDSNSFIIRKRGRPLLDYALRPRRTTPLSMPYHSQHDDPYVNVDMVKLLLERGADPNQVVRPNDGRTVWASFLLCSWEMLVPGLESLGNQTAPAKKHVAELTTQVAAWYKACEILVEHGARTDSSLDKSAPDVTAKIALETIFGDAKTESLCKLMKQVDAEKRWIRMTCVVL